MRYIHKIFLIAVAIAAAIPSFAVTDKEMEQARAIAAKHYLRYANNGSDYLDKLNPTSVAELTKGLKAKELENIKSFNAVSTPKDYASWDKKKLTEYWSSTFFKSPGLKEDGKKCLSILAKNLDKINVGAPAPTPAPEAEDKTAQASDNSKAPESAQGVDQPSSSAPDPAEEDVLADVAAQAQADAGLSEERPEKQSGTVWYIIILVILVGVVIWLVMYASKSMKENGIALADSKAGEKEVRELKRAAKEDQAKMREQYVSSLTSKNDEIKQLKKRCESLEEQLNAVILERDAARRDLDAARSEVVRERARMQELAQRDPKPVVSDQRPRQQAAPQRQPEPAVDRKVKPAPVGNGLPPKVYLGYVNQRGLFVKASRSLNPESSVFFMDIPDGHHGTFRVANEPEITDRLLADPKLWLEGGCVIVNPEDADIATEIATLENGEAYFADNTCRVVKKARIKFI